VEAFRFVKIWRTLLFAAAAVSLGLYIWLVERPRMATEGEPDKLVKFDPGQVSNLHIVYPEPPNLTLAKNGEDWRLTEPLEADADDEAVKRLLEQISNTTAERRIPSAEAQTLGTYGLEANGTQARMSLTLADGTKVPDVVIGNTTPVGFQAFVRVEGKDEIVLVPLLLHTGIKKSPFDLREKKLFALEPSQVLAAKLTTDRGVIDLTRAGDQWKITAPIHDEADAEQVRTLLRSLNDIAALAFYDGPDADRDRFGLTRPSLAFEVELGDHGAAGFRLGVKTAGTGSPPGYYMERISDGQVAAVPEWVATRFGQDVTSLRDKRAFHCETEDIAKVSFERSDGESYALFRADDGTWRIDPPQDRPVQSVLAERLLGGIASLAGKEIVSDSSDTPEKLAAFGLAAPAVQVEATNKEGRSCGRLSAAEVGAGSETPTYYIKRSEGGTVMTVPAYLYARLNMRAGELLEPKNDAGNGAGADQAPAPGKP